MSINQFQCESSDDEIFLKFDLEGVNNMNNTKKRTRTVNVRKNMKQPGGSNQAAMNKTVGNIDQSPNIVASVTNSSTSTIPDPSRGDSVLVRSETTGVNTSPVNTSTEILPIHPASGTTQACSTAVITPANTLSTGSSSSTTRGSISIENSASTSTHPLPTVNPTINPPVSGMTQPVPPCAGIINTLPNKSSANDNVKPRVIAPPVSSEPFPVPTQYSTSTSSSSGPLELNSTRCSSNTGISMPFSVMNSAGSSAGIATFTSAGSNSTKSSISTGKSPVPPAFSSTGCPSRNFTLPTGISANANNQLASSGWSSSISTIPSMNSSTNLGISSIVPGFNSTVCSTTNSSMSTGFSAVDNNYLLSSERAPSTSTHPSSGTLTRPTHVTSILSTGFNSTDGSTSTGTSVLPSGPNASGCSTSSSTLPTDYSANINNHVPPSRPFPGTSSHPSTSTHPQSIGTTNSSASTCQGEPLQTTYNYEASNGVTQSTASGVTAMHTRYNECSGNMNTNPHLAQSPMNNSSTTLPTGYSTSTSYSTIPPGVFANTNTHPPPTGHGNNGAFTSTTGMYQTQMRPPISTSVQQHLTGDLNQPTMLNHDNNNLYSQARTNYGYNTHTYPQSTEFYQPSTSCYETRTDIQPRTVNFPPGVYSSATATLPQLRGPNFTNVYHQTSGLPQTQDPNHQYYGTPNFCPMDPNGNQSNQWQNQHAGNEENYHYNSFPENINYGHGRFHYGNRREDYFNSGGMSRTQNGRPLRGGRFLADRTAQYWKTQYFKIQRERRIHNFNFKLS